MALRKLLNRQEVAAKTGIPLFTIGKWTRMGIIPYIQINGERRYYYDEAVIEKWLEGIQAVIKTTQNST